MKEENKTITEKKKKPELTDSEAMEVVKSGVQSRFRFCDTFVPRTILYAVAVEYKPDEFTNEIRAFVRQGEYVHSSQWEQALKYEKKFAELNKSYQNALKAKKLPINIKPPAGEIVTPLTLN